MTARFLWTTRDAYDDARNSLSVLWVFALTHEPQVWCDESCVTVVSKYCGGGKHDDDAMCSTLLEFVEAERCAGGGGRAVGPMLVDWLRSHACIHVLVGGQQSRAAPELLAVVRVPQEAAGRDTLLHREQMSGGARARYCVLL